MCTICRGLASLAFSAIIAVAPATADEDYRLETEYLATSVVERIPEVVPRTLTRNLIKLFEPAKVTITANDGKTDELYFRIFKPKTAAGIRYPLLVWLHGYGPKELLQPNVGQLEYLEEMILHDPIHPDKYSFYVVAPQCPPGNDRWFFSSASEADEGAPMQPCDATILLIKDLCDRLPIDPNRVYLSGVSYGGTSCWEMAARAPELFAAVAPLASKGLSDDSKVLLIKNVPIWAFHSEEDDPEGVTATVKALETAGGRAHLTLIPGDAHNCWIPAFEQHELFEWMLSQVRGSATSPSPPEFVKLVALRKTYQAFLSCLPTVAVVALITGTIYWELRRQKRRASIAAQAVGA
jgi:predicted esterase